MKNILLIILFFNSCFFCYSQEKINYQFTDNWYDTFAFEGDKIEIDSIIYNNDINTDSTIYWTKKRYVNNSENYIKKGVTYYCNCKEFSPYNYKRKLHLSEGYVHNKQKNGKWYTYVDWNFKCCAGISTSEIIDSSLIYKNDTLLVINLKEIWQGYNYINEMKVSEMMYFKLDSSKIKKITTSPSKRIITDSEYFDTISIYEILNLDFFNFEEVLFFVNNKQIEMKEALRIKTNNIKSIYFYDRKLGLEAINIKTNN